MESKEHPDLVDQSHNNCEHKPLESVDGDVEELQSCMPLHISLGTAEHFLNFLQQDAWDLDCDVKDVKGSIVSAAMEEALTHH